MPRSVDVLALAAPRFAWSPYRRWAVLAVAPVAVATLVVTVSMAGVKLVSAAAPSSLTAETKAASAGRPAVHSTAGGGSGQSSAPGARPVGSAAPKHTAIGTGTAGGAKQTPSSSARPVGAPGVSLPESASTGRAGSPAGSPVSTPSTVMPSSGFVAATGTSLTLAGQPYRMSGINIYMAASGGTPSSCGGELYPDVGVPLSQMASGIVVRFWAFQNFFVSNGAFDWTHFDQVLAIAAAHGDKVIPVLANQYNYCDGAAKDLGWYQRGYQSVVGPGDLVPYRQYVSAVVSRYANDPTIALWQLVNEGEAVNSNGTCDEPAALAALSTFSDDVGGVVHQRDPNHLVSLGTLAGYSGSGRQWCGAANGDYQTLMASPGVDVCDFHDYGYPDNPMGRSFAPNLASAIGMCHANNKPIMVAETGIYAVSSAQLATRAAQFTAKFAAQFQAGVVGELLWAWAVKPDYVLPAADPDYGVCPGDPSLALPAAF